MVQTTLRTLCRFGVNYECDRQRQGRNVRQPTGPQLNSLELVRVYVRVSDKVKIRA